MKISRIACIARIARFAVVMLAAVLQPAQAMAQTRTPPYPGILAPGPGLAGAKTAPKGADAGFMKDLDALRDTVYGYTLAPAETAVLADSLSARAQMLPMNPRDRDLILSRIEYLAGRAWQPLENSLSEKAEAALPLAGRQKKSDSPPRSGHRIRQSVDAGKRTRRGLDGPGGAAFADMHHEGYNLPRP